MTTHFNIKSIFKISNIQPALFSAIIIIILFGTIDHQDHNYSCDTNPLNQTTKNISIFLCRKNSVIQKLGSVNYEQIGRRELIKSQIERAMLNVDLEPPELIPKETIKVIRLTNTISSNRASQEIQTAHDQESEKALEPSDINDKAAETIIHVASGKYSPYYHIRFSLTPDNTVLTVPLSERKPQYSDNNDYVFAEGGQFEVFVERSKFPIPSPYSERKYLILRMPWTNISMETADQYIAEKYELFKRIKEMKETQQGSVEVSIELNPFVNVISEDPLQLELSNRNIFFRQAHGRHIDYVGSLKP